MEIRETMYDKKITLENNSPYLVALDLIKKLSQKIKITEKKNFYETDGPHHRSEIIAEIEEKQDNFSKTVFVLSFLGEEKSLVVGLEGRFEVAVVENGFFSESFSQFYVDRIFPIFRKRSEIRIKEIAAIAEYIVEKAAA